MNFKMALNMVDYHLSVYKMNPIQHCLLMQAVILKYESKQFFS